MAYQLILMRLVIDGRITVAAACGCVRMSYSKQAASSVVEDLYTADFLTDLLHDCTSHVPPALLGHSLQQLYSSCGVSLADLIPKVSRLSRVMAWANAIGPVHGDCPSHASDP